jgi:membrane protein implicated in regulation of membrane protease activity
MLLHPGLMAATAGQLRRPAGHERRRMAVTRVAGVDETCHDRDVPVIWLVAGVLLAVAEMFTLDFVLIMLATGAFAAALAGFVDASIPVQVVVFGVVSTLGLLAVRPAIKKRLHRGADPATMGVDAIEGAEATVIEQVAEGRGMVKIGGELWSARPYDATQVIEAGVLVRVVEVKGATALVWKE